jgi:shikimate dehydrogenase
VQDMVYTTIEGPLGQFAATVDAIRFDGGRVMAENVDRVGLVRDVVHNLGCALSGRRVPGAGLWLCRASGPGV